MIGPSHKQGVPSPENIVRREKNKPVPVQLPFVVTRCRLFVVVQGVAKKITNTLAHFFRLGANNAGIQTDPIMRLADFVEASVNKSPVNPRSIVELQKLK